ncbi:MAG TPA: heparan-alpha-glucosaminide N-acetyltransferase domain-containing protein [Terriglobales bacterium]|nr:heparan-alpha-glucosaminide N-acetyltransferase domain-containing protein [Terriglobales bacterium]
MPTNSPSRVAYIDWLRGLACVLMLQTHCYDAWLSPAARNSKFFTWSQLGGTFPAPLFLFLAGISLALVVDKLQRKGFTPHQIAKTAIRRGAEIFALGLLFRVQEFAIAWGWAPWSDLFRVDILNTIGVSLMMMGGMCWAVLALQSRALAGANSLRTSLATAACVVAAAISLVTPLLWTNWRPRFLPWPLESYIDGVHNLGQPQGWLFPIFPWMGFAFAGLAVGFLLVGNRVKQLGASAFALIGGAGILLFFAAKFFDSRSTHIYPVYDYWHTSPNFFMLRVGMLLFLVALAYIWCRWGPGTCGFSPLIQLGQTSLLVYWVHIEFVYGRFTILPHRGNSIATTSAGLIVIFLAMLALSLLRTNLRGKFAELELWRVIRMRPVQ